MSQPICPHCDSRNGSCDWRASSPPPCVPPPKAPAPQPAPPAYADGVCLGYKTHKAISQMLERPADAENCEFSPKQRENPNADSVTDARERDEAAEKREHMAAVKFADENSDIEEGRWTIAYDAFRAGWDACLAAMVGRVGMSDDRAVKLTEAALAFEKSQHAQRALEFLREALGSYEYERNPTVQFILGYITAMKRIERQADT